MSGATAEARGMYAKSWEEARAVGMREGVREARAAMRRLEREPPQLKGGGKE